MAEKRFTIYDNQNVWNFYYTNAMETWAEENQNLESKAFNEGYNKKKTSILQYKPIALSFESYIKKSFDNITAEDIENFAQHTDKKSKLAHLNAFLLTSVSNGYIQNTNLEFLIGLLPKEYRKLGKMIAGNK